MAKPAIFKQTNYQIVDKLKNIALNIVEAFEIIMIKIRLARENLARFLKIIITAFVWSPF